MIIDKLSNGAQYAPLHRNFGLAFDWLQAQDLEALEIGIHQLSDGVKMIVSENPGVEATVQKFECHNQNIDIQLLIRGNETMGWKPRQDCTQPIGKFDDERDVIFFTDRPDMYFSLLPGQFAIFYPDDVHAPMIGDGLIKKLVVKVAI
ncbi:YhcH/YjgK/YiaL family protein [Mucilaginibacter myungsuensis]|uniref:YhcH/YjgK/YiaL family protein n=1 Tax=Mucilaginibacter myungsuensis TaxID=649104 RepID=A0A929KZS7_9SPHI|nr:YhcH/YjgK/YiaL family protein [Mucilaginibacter myungsuensis]MBE9661874.1 YhcH/YjgK/YiaL family protein [Mucilaginibacter myungsuensis]MDN3599692.1 YhcH/YjgK/YiaL family protein [Mucilaginibacter myungsuensis]